MKSSIFKNKSLATQFEKEGFVVVPFFSEIEVSQLQTIYNGLPNNETLSFESTSFLEDELLKEKINSSVDNVFSSKVNELFENYKTLGTSFLTKRSGENTKMPIHQDWTVVDESQFDSVTCWVPLVDTTVNNGALQVIKGSHKFSTVLRGPSLPISFSAIDLSPFLQTLELKAGEALIFNHALIHASHANLSQESRVAVTFGLTNKEAQLLMYYSNKNKVEKWEMPDDMFLKYPKIRFTPTIGKLVEEFEYVFSKLTLKEINKIRLEQRKMQAMEPLFKNTEQQLLFEKEGYIKLPALSEEDILQLTQLHQKLGLKDEKGYGFHVGMDNADKGLVANMVEEISKIALPKLEKHLFETQLITASFVIKEPNPKGVVPPHQDWSFVENEQEHCSVTCWIPLQDVTMDNGCLGVIKGSNHFFENHRPSPSPQVETPLKKHMFTIFPFLNTIEMKAGEALIFNNKTIHASPPNITNQARLAVGLGFTQKNAELRHYYLKPGTDSTLLKYKITPDFFLKYDNATLSAMYANNEVLICVGQPEEMPYHFDDLDAATFVEMIQDAGNVYNPTLVSRMSELFKDEVTAAPETPETVQEVHQLETNVQEPVIKLPFWKVYTPINVLREIKNRISTN